jgi:hypothetical protein
MSLRATRETSAIWREVRPKKPRLIIKPAATAQRPLPALPLCVAFNVRSRSMPGAIYAKVECLAKALRGTVVAVLSQSFGRDDATAAAARRDVWPTVPYGVATSTTGMIILVLQVSFSR